MIEGATAHLGELNDQLFGNLIADAFFNKSVEACAEIARATVAEAAAELGLAVNDSSQIWKSLQNDRTCLAIRERLPHVASRISSLCAVFVDAAKSLAHRIDDPEVHRHGLLTGVTVSGDMHARGAVVILHFNSTPKLVYKPRSLLPDLYIRDVLEILEDDSPELVLPTHPRSVDRGSYGFQDFIGYSSPSTEADRAAYFHRFGALVALAYALSATDLHRENILTTAMSPVILDAECLFWFPQQETSQWPADAAALFGGKLSVLASHLLPNWHMQFRAAGASDTTTLGSYAHFDREPARRVVKTDSQGRPTIVYHRVEQLPDFPNQPHTREGVFPADGFEPEILMGFKSVYQVLQRQDVQDRLLGKLDEYQEFRVRSVRADTAAYAARLQSASKFTSGDVPSSNNRAGVKDWIRQTENFALNSGVVPLYELGVHSGALHAEDGTLFILEEPPRRLFQSHLRRLADDDRQAQENVIVRSLELGRVNPDEAPQIGQKRGAAKTGLDAQISALAERISLAVLQSSNVPWVLSSESLSPGKWGLRTPGSDYYSSVPGILIALRASRDPAVEDRCLQIEHHLIRAITDISNSNGANPTPKSGGLIGSGWAGPVLALSMINSAQPKSQIMTALNDFGLHLLEHNATFGGTVVVKSFGTLRA